MRIVTLQLINVAFTNFDFFYLGLFCLVFVLLFDIPTFNVTSDVLKIFLLTKINYGTSFCVRIIEKIALKKVSRFLCLDLQSFHVQYNVF